MSCLDSDPGSFNYSKSLGVRSTKPESKDKPLNPDTVLSIASCTKLFTAISALQCVERGLLALDDDVAGVLPELASLEIIDGFDEEAEMLLRPKTRAITLRSVFLQRGRRGGRSEDISPALRDC